MTKLRRAALRAIDLLDVAIVEVYTCEGVHLYELRVGVAVRVDVEVEVTSVVASERSLLERSYVRVGTLDVESSQERIVRLEACNLNLGSGECVVGNVELVVNERLT